MLTAVILARHAAGQHADLLNWPAAIVLVAGMGFIAFLAWLGMRCGR